MEAQCSSSSFSGSLSLTGGYWCLFPITNVTKHIISSFLIAQLVKNPPPMQETLVQFLGQKDPLEKGEATHSSFPGDSDCKESTCNARYLGSVPGLRRSPGEGIATHSNILAWRSPRYRGAWRATVHGVAESDMSERLSTAEQSLSYRMN